MKCTRIPVTLKEELDKNNGCWALTESAKEKFHALDIAIDQLLMSSGNDHKKYCFLIKNELEVIEVRLKRLAQIYMMEEADVYMEEIYVKEVCQ